MSFVKENVSRTPIVDTVFAIVAKAKEAKKVRPEAVTDATIGSLYGEDGQLAAFDTVFDSFKSLDNRTLAAYAAGFTGNPAFKEAVKKWVLQDKSHLYADVIATPGGTGAVAMTVSQCLDEGQTLIIPEIAWGSYSLMAQMNNLKTAAYSLFEGDHFNLDSFKKTVLEVGKSQSKIVVIINDPCHNPTGYSLTEEEWQEVVRFLNDVSKDHDVVLLNDIAYMDFSYRGKGARNYLSVFDGISDKVAVVIAFSLSKSMTCYGMRCGAAILLAKREETVQELRTVFEKEARAVWSNVNNGAMAMFADVMENHLDAYEAERDQYTELLKKRSDLFLKEANEAGLAHYPYKEGFFVTLAMDNDVRDKFHEALMAEDIYTVKVNKGIRVAVCSLPLRQVPGLAKRMKDILNIVEKG